MCIGRVTDKTEKARHRLTGVRAFVYLEVLGAREHLAAAGKQARKRFLSGVDADVVDQLVFGLERAQLAAAVAPQTHVVGLLARSAASPRRTAGTHVLDADVGY